MKRFVCPCCGHRTLPARPDAAWQLCEVCCWEDSRPGALGLVQASACFRSLGACDPELVALARSPRPGEAPPAWWFPLDGADERLGAEIDQAFAGVGLDGGVSLAEAELIDDYELPARSMHDPPPPGFGLAPPWQALSAEDLEAFPWGNFSFQDGRGLRYHIPAFLRYHLVRPDGLVGPGSLVFLLERGHQLDELEALLDAPQRRVIARFLAWLATDPLGEWRGAALKALASRWGADLDPDQARQFPLPARADA